MPYNDVVILGDFNSNILVESSFKDSMESIGITPANHTSPTHFSKSSSTLLDLILVGDSSKVLMYDQLSAPCFSKHDLIFTTYNFTLDHKNQTYSYRDFKNINHQRLIVKTLAIDWESIYSMVSIDDQLSFLQENILKLYDEEVPLKTKTLAANNRPWFNSIIKQAIRSRDFAYSRWKRFRTSELKAEFRRARKDVNDKIRAAKSEYYSAKLSFAISSSRTWKTIKDIGIGSSEVGMVSSADPNELNSIFTKIPIIEGFSNCSAKNYVSEENMSHHNEFEFSGVSELEVFSCCNMVKSNSTGPDNIHPIFIKTLLPILLPYLTYLFNNIITKSYFPSKWKHAKVIPVPKSNNEYRPISILGYFSKVLEKLLYVQISTHVHKNHLLSDKK